MKSILTAVSLILLVTIPGAADAQTSSTLPAGAMVRVWTTGPDPIVGKVFKIEGASMLIDTDSGQDVSIARDAVTRLDVGHRRPRAINMFKGIGLAIVAGAALGLSSGEDKNCWFICTPAQKAGVFSILFAPVGGVIGLVVEPGTKWETTSIGTVRQTSTLPTVSLKLRFSR
jgi:hypothetical protein